MLVLGGVATDDADVNALVLAADAGIARTTDNTDVITTGTLTLRSISGTFENNETITDGAGGSALVNGAISAQDVVLLGSVEDLDTLHEDVAGWAATMDASVGEARVRVTGAASTTISWTVLVELVGG